MPHCTGLLNALYIRIKAYLSNFRFYSIERPALNHRHMVGFLRREGINRGYNVSSTCPVGSPCTVVMSRRHGLWDTATSRQHFAWNRQAVDVSVLLDGCPKTVACWRQGSVCGGRFGVVRHRSLLFIASKDVAARGRCRGNLRGCRSITVVPMRTLRVPIMQTEWKKPIKPGFVT